MTSKVMRNCYYRQYAHGYQCNLGHLSRSWLLRSTLTSEAVLEPAISCQYNAAAPTCLFCLELEFTLKKDKCTRNSFSRSQYLAHWVHFRCTAALLFVLRAVARVLNVLALSLVVIQGYRAVAMRGRTCAAAKARCRLLLGSSTDFWYIFSRQFLSKD